MVNTKNISKKASLILLFATAFGLSACSTTPTGDVVITEPDVTQPDTGTDQNQYKGFVVQLTATSDLVAAQEMATKFNTEGYTTFVNPMMNTGSTLNHVQIGPYTTEAEARTVLQQMKQRYHQNTYVQNAIVRENI